MSRETENREIGVKPAIFAFLPHGLSRVTNYQSDDFNRLVNNIYQPFNELTSTANATCSYDNN